MTDRRSTSALAERLAFAIVEHGPAAGSRLTLLVRAQKAAVLRELRTNPMFESLGRGRGSRWRLAGNGIPPPWEPQGTDWEPLGTEVGKGVGEDFTRRLDGLERRVSELERHLAEVKTRA